MKFLDKSEVFILVATAVFSLLFSGLYLYYEFYLSSYFGQNPYEWFAFANSEKPPSTFDVVLSGFKDVLNLGSCLFLSYLSIFLVKIVRTKITIKTRLGNTLATSASLTLSLVLLYFIYMFLRFKLINEYTTQFAFDEIASQVGLFAVLYLLIIIPVVNAFNKRDFKKN